MDYSVWRIHLTQWQNRRRYDVDIDSLNWNLTETWVGIPLATIHKATDSWLPGMHPCLEYFSKHFEYLR